MMIAPSYKLMNQNTSHGDDRPLFVYVFLVFADGSRDARDVKQLSIQQPFFNIQVKTHKEIIK